MMYYEDEQTRKLIDMHLENIARLNAQIGIDSTEAESQAIKAIIKDHLNAIKNIDLQFWQRICPEK